MAGLQWQFQRRRELGEEGKKREICGSENKRERWRAPDIAARKEYRRHEAAIFSSSMFYHREDA